MGNSQLVFPMSTRISSTI